MSEDITTPQPGTTAPADTSNKQPAPEQPNGYLGGKYKTAEELENAYKEAEKKIGEQGQKIKEAEEFATYVKPVLDVIQTDEEVFKVLENKLRKSPTKSTDNPAIPDQGELRSAASDLLLARFEAEHSIDKLPPDDAAKVRREIGLKVAELTGQQLGNVDLRRLPKLLENVYKLVNPKSSSESKDEDDGTPSIPSSPGKSETTLSPEEASIAQGLGLTREQYLEGKKGLSKKYNK